MENLKSTNILTLGLHQTNFVRYAVTCVFLLCVLSAFPKSEAKKLDLNVYGSVADYMTHEYLSGCKAFLMLPDSTVIDSCEAKYQYYQLYHCYSMKVPQKGKYIIKVERKDYETTFSDFEIDHVYRRERSRKLPIIYIKRKKVRGCGDDVHSLEGVTVTATKVKFYNKGDTIVYNADAFQLSKGSMLDALVRQMPGVELKSDGRIFVNGRFVESLMLNGKDFFKGNNTVLLQNLPTYTVNTVKVYEKEGEASRFLKRDAGDKEYVMDVNLKKEYNIGYIGNVEAGGGTKDRYLARLFAMRTTDHSRIAAFANFNNLSDLTNPVAGSDWKPDKMPPYIVTTKKGGVNVNIDDRAKRYKYDGNASVTHYDSRETINTWRTNFLSSGDTYDRIAEEGRYRNFFLNMNNNLTLTPGGDDALTMIRLNQSANYSRYKHSIYNLSATASEMFDDSRDFMDEFSKPMLLAETRKKLLNRRISDSYTDKKTWRAKINAKSFFRMKHNGDNFNLDVDGDVFGADYDGFSHYRLDYNDGGTPATDFRNRYETGQPGRGYNFGMMSRYEFIPVQKFEFDFVYSYSQRYLATENSLYRLDKLSGWGLDTRYSLGSLPSEEEYRATLDATNSYRSRYHRSEHTPRFAFYWYITVTNKNWARVILSTDVNIIRERLDYRRGSVMADNTRNTTFVSPGLEFKWNTMNRTYQDVILTYFPKWSTPDMLYSLDITSDSDPLNVTVYGKKLRNSLNHPIDLTYSFYGKRTQMSANANFSLLRNAIAMGYVYDRSTGRREFSPYNVNGNWNFRTGFNLSTSLDRKQRFYLTSNTSWQFVNSVDLIGTDASAAPAKSTVKTSVLGEDASLDYKFGKQALGIRMSFSWISSEGDAATFRTINAYNYHYGLNATLSLPWELGLTSEMMMYSRRGYEDASMNDDNFVWNARLSRSIFNGRVVLMADAFDIFGNLKKVDRTINAQGRMERFYKTVPRYVLFHAIFRFQVFPKKR